MTDLADSLLDEMTAIAKGRQLGTTMTTLFGSRVKLIRMRGGPTLQDHLCMAALMWAFYGKKTRIVAPEWTKTYPDDFPEEP